MQNELLALIDNIESEQAFAEMSVCSSLMESYSKSCMILEYSDNVDVTAFEVFQEGVLKDSAKEATGNSSENIIVRILLFIPRFIAAFIRNVKNSKKSIKKKIDEVENLGKDLVDTVKNPEAHMTNKEKTEATLEEIDAYVNSDKFKQQLADAREKVRKHFADEKDEAKKEPEIPDTREGVLGKSYGDSDAANRKAARDVRSMNKKTKAAAKQSAFMIPMKSNWEYDDFYAKGDVRLELPLGILTFVRALNHDTIDYAAIMQPVLRFMDELVQAFNSNPRDGEYKSDVIFDIAISKLGKMSGNTLSGWLDMLSHSLDEADGNLQECKKTIKKYTEYNHKDFESVMLQDVLRQYHYALDWMKYVEDILSDTQRRMKKITDGIETLKKNKTKIKESYNNRKGEKKEVSVTMNTNERQRLIQLVNRAQKIVTTSEKEYQSIIRTCYDGLGWMQAAICYTAEKSGIELTERGKRLKSDAHFHFSASRGDTIGYVDGGYGTKYHTAHR